jgi:hypothetical protein
VSRRDEPTDFGAYLAPGVAPLSAREADLLRLQTADLLGCDADELRPQLAELQGLGEIEGEFSWIPESEQCRGLYLALVALLRNGVHAQGHRCCMLVHDLEAPFPALDFLKGLEEVTHLPVLLAVCRKLRPGSGERQILVRRLR